MWKKTRFITLLLLIALIILAFLKNNDEISQMAQENFGLSLKDPHLVGWNHGQKVWQIKASSIVTSLDGQQTILKNIYEGTLYHENEKKASFTAPEVIYDRDTGNLTFPQGIILKTLTGNELTIGKAAWEGASECLTGTEKIILTGTTFSITADSLQAEKGASKLTIAGHIKITTKEGTEIKTDNLLYEVDDKRLTLAGQTTFTIHYKDMPPFTGSTARMELLLAEKKVILPESSAVEVLGYRLQITQGIFDEQLSLLQLHGVTGESPQGEHLTMSTATVQPNTGDVSADHVEVLLMTEKLSEEAKNEEVRLMADHFQTTTDGKWIVTGNVTAERAGGDRLSALRAEISPGNYSINLLGTVNYQQADGKCQLSADQVTYSYETGKAQADGHISITQEDGVRITSSKADVDCTMQKINLKQGVTLSDKDGTTVTAQNLEYISKEKQAILTGDVKVTQHKGRKLTADKMILNVETGASEFIGNIKTEKGAN